MSDNKDQLVTQPNDKDRTERTTARSARLPIPTKELSDKWASELWYRWNFRRDPPGESAFKEAVFSIVKFTAQWYAERSFETAPSAERQTFEQWWKQIGEPEVSGTAYTIIQEAFRAGGIASERADIAKDAARYRWLNDTLHGAVGGGVEINDAKLIYEEPAAGEAVRIYWYPNTPVGFNQVTADTLDAAIDEAMK